MEIFLSDIFINEVLSSEYYLRKFIENHPEFKRQKINLSEIYSEFDKIRKVAKSVMIGTIFHKLSTVKQMYEKTLAINFPDISKMQKFVLIRHDLVHRNGKTVDENVILLDESDILELFDVTTALINGIYDELEDLPF